MTSWERIAGTFDSAVRLPPGERSRVLDELCGDDADLRREVESMLAADDRGAYLVPPCVVPDPEARVAVEEGALVADFRVLRRLGAGGMGTVHEAEQQSPRRTVALKLLPRFADAAAAARFAREAELLARMNHPSIAQVYAAGVDGTTPYLAMELIEGALTITEFVRSRAMSALEAVALFRHVCAAVAHGHSKGVVHRDLKPGNVLVDGRGHPKVIDFGVARALDAAGDAPSMTRTGELVGTLQYLSPEQAQGRVGEVGAQSDVHALGLLLYELVCGRRAYALDGKPLTQALRAIAEDAIPPVRSVRPGLPAELEWILAKALEKDRARRYASVAEFDADLARLLAHERVLAGPPSRLYAARKFVRRHRAGVAALAAVFATLLLGLLAQARERAKVEAARDQLGVRARELEVETARKDRILAFQNRLLTAASHDAQGYDVRVVDLLDIARAELATTSEEPEVALELHRALGEAYASLGRAEDALAEARAALSIARTAPGISPASLAGLERAVLLRRSGISGEPGIADEARALLARDLERLGPAALETLRAADVLANHLARAGSLEEADAVASTALDHCASREGAEAAALARSLAAIRIQRGRFAEAETLLREAVEAGERRSGPTAHAVLLVRSMLVDCLSLRGAVVEAEKVARAAAEAYARRSGPDHADTLSAELTHGQLLLDVGRDAEARALLDRIVARARPLTARDGIEALNARARTGSLLDQCGRYAEAIAILREVHAQRVDRQLFESVDTVQTASSLAGALRRAKLLDEAEAVARDAVAMGEPRHGRSARAVYAAYQALAMVLLDQRRPEEAIVIVTENVATRTRVSGAAHDDALRALELLARALASGRRFVEAERAIREALGHRVESFGADHTRTLQVRGILASILTASGRPAEAEGEYCEIVHAHLARPSHPAEIVASCAALADARRALGRGLDAVDADRAGFAAAEALPPASPERIDAALRLAGQWLRIGQPAPVPALLEPLYEICASGAGVSPASARRCGDHLLASYEALGREPQAAALRERIAAAGAGR